MTIKSAQFPNRTFTTKEELFSELKNNKENILQLKKATVKNSDSILFNPLAKGQTEIKSLKMDDGYIYAVINTTKFLDSHDDVHIDGIWNKSSGEQQGKVYYIADHDLSIGKVIAYPKNVQILLEEIPFTDLGADYTGKTQALVFKVSKENIELEQAKSIINQKVDIEHSVRMQYVKIDLAINSDSNDFTEEKAVWDKYIGEIANVDKAIEQGYFFAVTEAKIYKEGSMVLSGSNSVTPLLQKQNIEPSTDTQNDESQGSTQNKTRAKRSHQTFIY